MRLNISGEELLRGLVSKPVTKENAVQPEPIEYRRISFAHHLSGTDSDVAGLTTLGEWVRISSSEPVRLVCDQIRAIEDDGELRAAKAQLPVCFPSGVFSTRDSKKDLSEKLVSYSGVIAVDIDAHDATEAAAAVDALASIEYVAFASVSASGRGAYAFAVTDNWDYDRHKIYWRAVSDDIAERTGYENDPATKDVTRARYVSYTPTVAFKDSVVPFSLPEGYKEPQTIEPPNIDEDFTANDTLAAIEDCVRQWEEQGLILGDGTYNTRYCLGTALKNLGEEGYKFYERICKGYTHPRSPRKEFDGFPANPMDGQGKISLATFFWIMRERYGIKPTDEEARLPLDELNPEISEIVKEVSKVYQCPLEFAIVSMYVAVAAVAGHKFALWDGKYTNFAQLWAAIVAPSGTGKSEALDWFFKPVEALETERYKAYRAALQEWKEGGEKGPKPKYRRSTAVDTTPEVRDQILADNPNGLCLKVDELKGQFDNLCRYNKSGEVSNLLSGYSNKPYTVDRKTQEPLRIDCPVLSIVGTIQPGIFSQAFGRPQFLGNGFLPRWLFVWSDVHPKRKYSEMSVNPEISRKWSQIIGKIDGVAGECNVQLSAAARAIYQDYYNELEEKIYRSKDDEKKEVFAKVQVNVLRWALITGILACEYVEVSDVSMQYAVVCSRYFETTGLKAVDAVKGQSRTVTLKDVIQTLKALKPSLIQTKLAEAIGVSEAYISKVLKGHKK